MATKPTVVSQNKLPVLLRKTDGISAPSEKLKNKTKELANKSNTSIMAKTIAGTGTILPGFVGKLDKDSISERKLNQTITEQTRESSREDVSGTGPKKTDSLVVSLNKLYKLHKKIIEKDDVFDRLTKNQHKKEMQLKEKMHKELLAVLTGKPKTEVKKEETKEEENKPSKITKPRLGGQKGRRGKRKSNKIGSFLLQNAPEIVAVGGVAATSVYEAATKSDTTKPAPQTATKIPNTPLVSADKKDVLAAMSGAESKGNYNIAYGDRIDKQGKMVNVAGVPTAEEYAGKKLTEMTLEEVQQFQQARNSKVKNTGAVGKYQFVGSTLFNKGGLVDQLGMDKKTTLFNSETQDKLALLLMKGNTAIMQAAGVPDTPSYQYMSWYVGPSGAAAVYNAVKNGKGNLTVAEAIKQANLPDPSAQNKELTTIQAKDFESILGQRLVANGLPSSPSQVASTSPGTPGTTTSQSATQVRVTSKFGMRDHPVTKQPDSMHQGVDLAGKVGDPVHATGDGTVTIPSEDPRGYGKWVIVNHADGLQTYYAHLSEITVKQGDQVKAGSNIGKVGNTGMSTGPHLHYQVMKNGKAVDPQESIPSLANYAVAMTGAGLPSEQTTMLAETKPNVNAMSVENAELKTASAQQPVPVVINNVTTVGNQGSGPSQTFIVKASKETLSRESALMWSQRGYS